MSIHFGKPIKLKDLLENPALLEGDKTDQKQKNREQCIECGQGHLKQLSGTYTWRCDRYPDCRHEENYPPENGNISMGGGRIDHGCVAGE